MKHARYVKNLAKHSDIREHLGLLRGLALECDVIVELGFRTGVSTSAFLAAERPVVHSYDLFDCKPQAQEFQHEYGDKFRFKRCPSYEPAPFACDMLFIDTDHTEETTTLELNNWGRLVRRWIVLHDTKTFGRVDRAPGKGKGILAAVEAYIHDPANYFHVILQLNNNNGLTILERLR